MIFAFTRSFGFTGEGWASPTIYVMAWGGGEELYFY